MKYLLFILLNCLFINSLLSYDFEVEMLNSTDPNNTHIVKYSDLIIYRQFKYTGNWKDNLGDWGKLDCAGNHTIIKEKGTILKNYCKGKNKDGDIFWLIMDRKSDSFDTGIGRITYNKGTGKFEKYEGAECVYAITFLPDKDGTFIKSRCKFSSE